MRMQFRQSCSIVTLILLISCFLWNCGDPKEESKAPVVSKKISVQKKPEATSTSVPMQTDASVKVPDAKGTDEQEASAANRIYDPAQRLNPFIPLYRTEDNQAVADSTGKTNQKKRKKRIPQTPLERISLDQLKLVAIIRASSGNRALVEESSGKGFIIKNGTYIGLNSGMVTQISADSVIVEEELENLMGELNLQNTEIKLQKPAGE